MTVRLTVRLTLAAIALIFVATCAQGQETIGNPRYLKISMGVFTVAAGADEAKTIQAMKFHGQLREANPLIAGLDHRPVLFAATIVSADVVGAWAWQRYVGRRHPKWAAGGFYAITAFRVWCAINNARMIRSVTH